MKLQLFTQPFCAPCIRARHVVERVAQLLPDLEIERVDVVADWERGRSAAVASTPVIRLLQDERPVFRADNVPSVNQLLVAIAAHRAT